MGSAIWSADPDKFREFPARYFAEFFNNHGFLNIRNQLQWLVIKGGSSRYVAPLNWPGRIDPEKIYRKLIYHRIKGEDRSDHA